MPVRVIKWDEEAVAAFKAAIAYIRKRSPQNADSVKQDILQKIDSLATHPEMYPPDKWKEKNKQQFRAFELHRFRISYKVADHEIIVARFRHTSQQPEEY